LSFRPDGRLGLVLAGLFSFHAICFAGPGASPAEAPPPHGLVTAAQALYQRKLPAAFDLVIDLGLKANEVTGGDRARLLLLLAMRQLDALDEAGARKATGEALLLDRGIQVPPSAGRRARGLELNRRAGLPAYAPPRALRAFLDVRAKLPVETVETAAPRAPVEPVRPAPGPRNDVGERVLAAEVPPSEPQDALVLGGGIAVGVGALVVIASSSQSPSSTAGLVVGAALGVGGAAALLGGLVVSNRPELLHLRITAAPGRGGLLLAAGRF